jgi:ubiquinone/menaquinone biosynthesis C-methylase UbiE
LNRVNILQNKIIDKNDENPISQSDHQDILDIIFGRWKSQILYAGVVLGVFDSIKPDSKNTSDIANELQLDCELTYRLLRALGSLGLLKEEVDSKDGSNRFSLTRLGKLLTKGHIQSLRGITLLEEGPEHYAIWKHLPAMIKDGQQNAFLREYGYKIFDYAERNVDYATTFNQAMASYSAAQTTWVLEALEADNFSNVTHICDVGGGTGHLLANLLMKYPHLRGTVLDLEPVTSKKEALLAHKLGVNDRCSYVCGDMFKEVPPADAYIMKMILHDWNDDECVKILTNVHRASPRHGRLFIAEHLIPGPHKPHFSKLFDIHMMCVSSGKERTADEFTTLLQRSGWKYSQILHPRDETGLVQVIEAKKQSN